MELSELILAVLHQANNAVSEYTRGAVRPAAESLAWISNKITKELPNIELPTSETSESSES